MRVRFYLDRKKRDGTKLIRAFILINSENKFWYKTDQYTRDSKWNQRTQTSSDKVTQSYLEVFRLHLADIQKRAFMAGHDLTPEYVRRELSGKKVKKVKKSFFEYFDHYVEKMKPLRASSTLRKFTVSKQSFFEFNSRLSFDDIDQKFFSDYMDWAVYEKNLLNNTLHKYISCLRQVCKLAQKEGASISDDYKEFAVSGEKVRPVFLTKEEGQKLLNVEIKSKLEGIVRDDFAIRYYLGLRDSDIRQINKSNVIQQGNHHYLKITLFKSKNKVDLPIPDKAMDILIKHDFEVPVLAQQTKNKVIKDLAERAEINTPVEVIHYSGPNRITKILPKYKLITTHTMRRSYGRRFMESGGNINILKELFGHANSSTTEDYIGWESQEISDAVKKIEF